MTRGIDDRPAYRKSLGAMLAVSLCCLSACSGLPADGPSTSDILDKGQPGSTRPEYPVVDLTGDVLRALEKPAPTSLRETFGDQVSPQEATISAGDYVAAVIWEIGSNGLFSNPAAANGPLTGITASSQNAAVPEQMVASDGTITVPYAGRIKIAGLNIADAQHRIEASLRGKAQQPQVMLAITRNLASVVTVTGDDIKGGPIPITPTADRLLDVIAAAGGVNSPTYQAQVKLVRNGKATTVSLDSVIREANENIHLFPQDILIVSKNPSFFTALGALGHPAQIQFQNDHVSLAQAIGLAGGLLDERADPAGVFIFRYEASEIATKVCAGCANAPGASVPVVYRLDMSQPSAFFLSQQFTVADRDVIFIANAPRVQLQKFLAMVRDITSPILTGAIVGRAAEGN